jgi:hypothetical protein
MHLDKLERYEQYKNWLRDIDCQLAFHLKPTESLVFSDESGTHNDARYFGIGSLMVWHRTPTGQQFGVELLEMFKSRKWTDEFKWSDVSRGNVHRYRDFTDTFFESPKTVRFHCLVIDRSLLSKRKGKFYDTLFRFYFLLLAYRLNPTASWRSNRRSILIPDRMDLGNRYWERLFHSVNGALKRKYGVRHYPVVECLPIDSKVCLEVQMADVLLGSVIAQYNDDFQSQHKQSLSKELTTRIMSCDKTKASIWKWQPSAK